MRCITLLMYYTLLENLTHMHQHTLSLYLPLTHSHLHTRTHKHMPKHIRTHIGCSCQATCLLGSLFRLFYTTFLHVRTRVSLFSAAHMCVCLFMQINTRQYLCDFYLWENLFANAVCTCERVLCLVRFDTRLWSHTDIASHADMRAQPLLQTW